MACERELSDWEKEAQEKAKKIIKEWADIANVMSSSGLIAEAMMQEFIRQHRTLQQAIVRSFVTMLQKWAGHKEEMTMDMRNEAAWKFARKLIADGPCFPLI